MCGAGVVRAEWKEVRRDGRGRRQVADVTEDRCDRVGLGRRSVVAAVDPAAPARAPARPRVIRVKKKEPEALRPVHRRNGNEPNSTELW